MKKSKLLLTNAVGNNDTKVQIRSPKRMHKYQRRSKRGALGVAGRTSPTKK